MTGARNEHFEFWSEEIALLLGFRTGRVLLDYSYSIVVRNFQECFSAYSAMTPIIRLKRGWGRRYRCSRTWNIQQGKVHIAAKLQTKINIFSDP